MNYVYFLQSKTHPNQHYVGITSNLKNRLKEHNSGKSIYTSKYVPWKIVAAIYFEDKKTALAFEKYIKSGSGHAFAKRHIWPLN